MSSYLFVLCIEHLILDGIHNGSWKPISICRGRLILSHLMFADDNVLFVDASLEQMQVIKKCLDAFCSWFGQGEL